MATAAPKSRQPREAQADALAEAQALVETLRASLARHGLHESHSARQDGFYFTVGENGDVSLEYNDGGASDSSPAATLRRNERAILNCCHELVLRGFAFSLFMSPRTVALHIVPD